jgi:hypothetical protein
LQRSTASCQFSAGTISHLQDECNKAAVHFSFDPTPGSLKYCSNTAAEAVVLYPSDPTSQKEQVLTSWPALTQSAGRCCEHQVVKVRRVVAPLAWKLVT